MQPFALAPLTLVLNLAFAAALARSAPPITALALSPDGQQVLVGSQQGITVHPLGSHEAVRRIDTQLEHVHDLKFSPDGQTLLAVGGAPAQTGQAQLFSWPAGNSLKTFHLSEDLLYRADWSGDSRCFATCGQSTACNVTSRDGQSMAVYSQHARAVSSINFLDGSSQLISAGSDTTIQLWSIAGQRIRTLNNHTAAVTDLAVQPGRNDPPKLASASEDRTVRCWQPAIGRMIRFVKLESAPRRVAWHGQEHLLAACDDGTLVEIDAQSMRVVRTFRTTVRPIYELVIVESRAIVGGEGGLSYVSLVP